MPNHNPQSTRRRTLKAASAGSLSAVTLSALPAQWQSPLVKAVLLPAHARPTNEVSDSMPDKQNLALLADPDSYQYLYDINAERFGGYTVRWESNTITVAGAKERTKTGANWRRAVDRWNGIGGITLSHVEDDDSSANIRIRYNDNLEPVGQATYYINTYRGEFISTAIEISPDRETDSRRTGIQKEELTVTHEIGHSLGFFNHSTDGGVMINRSSTGSGEFSDKTLNLINLLYSIDPGTDIRPYTRLSSADERNQPRARPRARFTTIVVETTRNGGCHIHQE